MSTFVLIKTFLDIEEACCAMSYLTSRGVDASLQNEYHAAMDPSLRFALGGFRIIVRSTEANAAIAALDEIASVEETEISDAETPSHRRNWLWAPLAFLTQTPFVVPVYSGWRRWFSIYALISFYAVFLFAGVMSYFNW